MSEALQVGPACLAEGRMVGEWKEGTKKERKKSRNQVYGLWRNITFKEKYTFLSALVSQSTRQEKKVNIYTGCQNTHNQDTIHKIHIPAIERTQERWTLHKIHTSFYITLNCSKFLYILNDFSRNKFCLNNKLFECIALMGYVIQYSTTIYINLYIYLMVALCGQNMSLNLHESSNSANNLRFIGLYLCVHAHMSMHVSEWDRECEGVSVRLSFKNRRNMKYTCDLYGLSSNLVSFNNLVVSAFHENVNLHFPEHLTLHACKHVHT
jgi:hypothetical protein